MTHRKDGSFFFVSSAKFESAMQICLGEDVNRRFGGAKPRTDATSWLRAWMSGGATNPPNGGLGKRYPVDRVIAGSA
jgi:hypothetical protein